MMVDASRTRSHFACCPRSSIASRWEMQSRHGIQSPATDVLVVDVRPQDYLHLAQAFAPWLRFQFAMTGEAAFHLRPHERRCHWLVNVGLPDVTGFDLVRSLRGQSSTASVALVDDSYSAEREVLARICGAAYYACKPLEIDWFAKAWCPAVSPRAFLPREYVV